MRYPRRITPEMRAEMIADALRQWCRKRWIPLPESILRELIRVTTTAIELTAQEAIEQGSVPGDEEVSLPFSHPRSRSHQRRRVRSAEATL